MDERILAPLEILAVVVDGVHLHGLFKPLDVGVGNLLVRVLLPADERRDNGRRDDAKDRDDQQNFDQRKTAAETARPRGNGSADGRSDPTDVVCAFSDILS